MNLKLNVSNFNLYYLDHFVLVYFVKKVEFEQGFNYIHCYSLL